MKPYLHNARIGTAIVLGCLALCLASCKKTPDTIGNNLIDESNIIGVGHTDTLPISSHSYIVDSIGTKNVRYGLLGCVNDPVFGPTTAGFYTQFRFSATGQNFGSSPVVDSVVLQLSLVGIYGDSTCWQTVNVYELADTISATQSYYGHSEIAVGAVDLANAHQFVPHLANHVQVIGTDTLTQPIIRIPLANELGNALVQLDSSIYSQPELFKSSFKGLFVTAAPITQSGAVCSINLTNNTLTRLQLYYHDATLPEKPMRYDYYITSVENCFNHFGHDYAEGDEGFVSQVVDGDTALGQTRLYVQAMGGVRARIRFPGLAQRLAPSDGQHIVVNEAKLVIPASPADADTSLFKAPQKLVLTGFKEDGSTYIIPDNFEGDAYFGGTYDSKTQTVSFRISEYIERIILGKEPDFGLSLGVDGAAYNAQRWVINGPEAATGQKMHLELTYSIVSE